MGQRWRKKYIIAAMMSNASRKRKIVQLLLVSGVIGELSIASPTLPKLAFAGLQCSGMGDGTAAFLALIQSVCMPPSSWIRYRDFGSRMYPRFQEASFWYGRRNTR